MRIRNKIKLILVTDIVLAMLAIFNAYLITQKPAIPLMDKMNGTKFDFDSDVFQKNDIIISLNSLKVYSSEELEFLCDQRKLMTMF